MILQILQDALFSAIAAIGFAAISRPPAKAFYICAVIAAVGHSVRFVMLREGGIMDINIVIATFVAAFIVGVLAVFMSPMVKTPAETCLFPALLPMIPGVYAYKSFAGLMMCMLRDGEKAVDYYFYQFAHNGLTCLFIIAGMVVGATMPIFIFKKISFQATR